jgi:hypothetical protein
MLARLATIFCIILAGFMAVFIVRFFRLDLKKNRTLGFLGGLWFSLIQINTTIVAVLFRIGTKYRPTGSETGADDIIASWPIVSAQVPVIIIFFTLAGWLVDLLLAADRRRH